MKTEIIIAILSFFGTLIGTLGGIVASARIMAYRIEQLEKKVDKHNNFAERIPLLERDIKVINHRIDDLEELEREKKQ